jgi:thiamine-phosphate pyrophosphorylase
MGKPGLFDLLLITDEAPDLPDRVARALQPAPRGRVAVQLRHKSLPAEPLLELAHHLRTITRERGALLLVNDRIDLAQAVEADGVHLPERGFPVEVARHLLGEHCLIGRSCHDAAGLARAARDRADYATLAPVHAVPGKGPPLGIDGFARLCRAASLPVYALGGITAAHVSALRASGARGVAVIRHALADDEPDARVAALLALL